MSYHIIYHILSYITYPEDSRTAAAGPYRIQNIKHRTVSSCLYSASMTIKTLYYPTDAQIYNS